MFGLTHVWIFSQETNVLGSLSPIPVSMCCVSVGGQPFSGVPGTQIKAHGLRVFPPPHRRPAIKHLLFFSPIQCPGGTKANLGAPDPETGWARWSSNWNSVVKIDHLRACPRAAGARRASLLVTFLKSASFLSGRMGPQGSFYDSEPTVTQYSENPRWAI